MEKQVNFKSKARLMPQIGDQLIKNENIALLELVKNSYDAWAHNVCVEMYKVDDPSKGTIIITDDGDGMDMDTVENSWMEIGTDNKKRALEELVRHRGEDAIERVPMGEKGIGRFGVHKLGNKIKLVTRKRGCDEVCVEIDWSIFNDYDYLEDVPIVVTKRNPEVFINNQTGTRIEITGLKTVWTRGKLRNAKRSIISLHSPFESIQSFNVDFKTDHEDWIKDTITIDEVKENALFLADVFIDDDKMRIIYDFRPWNVLGKLGPRHVELSYDEIQTKADSGKRNDLIKVELSKYKIGPVRMKLLMYALDSSVLSYGSIDSKGLKEYLANNGGIAVYRDNIRIYEYGDAGNDWLNLESKRINAPGETISSKITLGAVYIDRLSSTDLIEKTNREGFVENDAFIAFRDAIIFAIEKIQTQRNIDKNLIMQYYGPTKKSEPVLSSVEKVRKLVEKKIKDDDLKKTILTSLQNIERDYQDITERYIRSSSAGLSLSVVIHEIEKIIAELQLAIKAEGASKHVDGLVSDLVKVTDGYASVIRSNKFSTVKLSQMLDDAIFNVKYRAKCHGLEVLDYYKKYPSDNYTVKCSSNLVIGTIMNLVDNAIYWLDFAHVNAKKILLDYSTDYDGYITVIFADNGKGFTLPTDQIVKPFVTDKIGGMGLGLHLADEIMKSCGGKLLFPDYSDVELPEEFINGAILGLAFPIKDDKGDRK